MSETTEEPEIEKTTRATTRVHAQVKSFGYTNAKGKSSMVFGYQGKQMAEPDRPLSTLGVWFLNSITTLARYTDNDELCADLASLKEYVNSLEPQLPKEADR